MTLLQSHDALRCLQLLFDRRRSTLKGCAAALAKRLSHPCSSDISAAAAEAAELEPQSFKSDPGGGVRRESIEGTGSYEDSLRASRRASAEVERISAAADAASPGGFAPGDENRLSSIESVASEVASPDGGGGTPSASPTPMGADRP